MTWPRGRGSSSPNTASIEVIHIRRWSFALPTLFPLRDCRAVGRGYVSDTVRAPGKKAVDKQDLISLAEVAAIGLAIAMIYAAPALIAAWRRHRRAEQIALLNLLLGWTVIGWLALLVWALRPRWLSRLRSRARGPIKNASSEPARHKRVVDQL